MLIRWIGSILGIAGALVLAINMPISKYGYIMFFLSSVFLTVDFLRSKNHAMILQQGVFMIINFVGIIRWLS